ncbi:MAG: PAS domain S-box protein [Zoogloeaceae bacterium]|nr:PAS domain S-box protein [Zoogloeaceae bacterium]
MKTRQDRGVAPLDAMGETKASAVRLMGWILLAGPSLYLLLLLFAAFPGQAVRGVASGILLLLGIAILLLQRAGHGMRAARLLVYAGTAAIAVAILLGGGIYAPQIILPPLAVILAGWLLGPRHAIAVTALSVLLGLAVAVAAHLGRMPQSATAPPLLMWLTFAIATAIICLLTLSIVRNYETRLAEVHQLGVDLAVEKEHFRLIAESVPAMLAHNDRAGVLRYANRHYLDFFGRGRNAIGGHVRDIIGAENYEELAIRLEHVYSGNTVSYQAIRRNAAGEACTLDVVAVPARDADGTVSGVYATMRDVTEQLRAEDKFRKVFRSNPLAIAITRLEDGRYLDVNEAFIALFGWAREEVIGRTSADLGKWMRPEDRERWVAALRRDGRAPNRETRFRTRSGDALDVLMSTELIHLDGEACALVMVSDITDRRRAEVEIRRLNDDLEARVAARTAELTAANRELESFAYSISHDLRAPLRGIDGFSHLLAEEYAERLDDTGRGYLERVRRAAQRMGTLIDDILELSRVTRQEMRRVRVDLSQLAAELLEERARSEPGRQVALSIAPECIAYGDPQLLRVLMQNLIENAWKYTRRTDPARIAFGTEKVSPGETAFFVRDNGVGFDMQYAGRLFTPFQRLHKPEEFEGTGIGLATVARIAHRHGGRIWVEASPNQGATFRFTLSR